MIIGHKNSVPQRIPIKKVCDGYYLRWYYNGWHYWFFLTGQSLLQTEGENYRTVGTRKVSMGTGQITYEQCQAIRTILNTREIYMFTSNGWMNMRIEPGSIIVSNNQVNGYEFDFIAIIGSKAISVTGFSPIEEVPEVPSIPDPSICEIIIGSQIWMCKNYEVAYPGSKVYSNNEANRTIYGGLYTYLHVKSAGFCPTGWHVPTLAEWNTLITTVGGLATSAAHLKTYGLAYWNNPNVVYHVDNIFDARGGGYCSANGSFNGLKVTGNFWLSDQYDSTQAYFCRMFNDQAYSVITYWPKNIFMSVRLIRDTPALPYDDWFLPSKDGVIAMRTELYAHGVGDFSSETYWSSSEYNAAYARGLVFDPYNNNNFEKNGGLHVRACRSFIGGVGEYNIRDTGPAGGLIFAYYGGKYYEAAPTDQSISYIWSNLELLIGASAQGTTIDTGQANTTAIIAQAGHTDSAAKLCDDLIIYH